MKKIIKNPIFTFILGAIIFGSIGVLASNILAQDVTYGNTNVKLALDVLYTKAKPDYAGDTTVTPTTSEQTLLTNDRILKSNITVEAIPSTYKNLSQSTTVEANKLLNGETAYDNLGNLITGSISTDCVTGSIPKNSNSKKLTSFKPSKFVVFGLDESQGNHWGNIYSSSYNATKFIDFGNGNTNNYSILRDISTWYNLDSNSLYITLDTTNHSLFYIACK